MTAEETGIGNRKLAALITCACIFALFVRLYRLDSNWLWYDEIFGTTFAVQSLFEMLVSETRFDAHPPAWYLQLFFWAKISHSDTWFLLNSVMWSTLSVLSIGITAAWIYDWKVGVLSSLFLAIMPISVAYAQIVRMYAMLGVLVTWGWYCQVRFLTGKGGHGHLTCLVLSELAVVYTHLVGMVIVFYLGICGLWQIVDARPERSRVRSWLLSQTLAALLTLPSCANSLIRSKLEHITPPDFESIRQTLASLWFGMLWTDQFVAGWIGLGLTVLLCIGGICFSRGRSLTACLILLPLLMSLALTFTLKPMWHLHSLLFMAPLMSLALALLILNLVNRLGDRTGRVVLASVASVFILSGLLLSGYHARKYEKNTKFPWLIAEIRSEIRTGDVIYAPNHFDYWGVAWYYVGDEWGSPLEIQDMQFPSDRWGKLLRQMGPQWREFLHLQPKQPFVHHQGVDLFVGTHSRERVQDADPRAIFFVHSNINPTDPLDLPGYRLQRTVSRYGLTLHVLVHEE